MCVAAGMDIQRHLKCAQVERFLEEQEPIEEDDDGFASDGVDQAAPKQTGSGFGSTLSEPMAAFLGETSLPRTQVGGMLCLVEDSGCIYTQHHIRFSKSLMNMQVVKRIWEYIKANDLQDPKNRRKAGGYCKFGLPARRCLINDTSN